jgi:hypothetical protein
MDARYKQFVADFPFDRETITPFGGDCIATMCRVEIVFKEISNRSLATKHALWKGDLWLADDLINDNCFTAIDAIAEIWANRFAICTGSNAYWDKHQNVSVNASSVIADLTYTTAKQTKARNDFYSKSVPGIDLTTGTTGMSGGWSPSSSSSGYGQSFFGARTHTPTTRPTSPSSREREEGRARFRRFLEVFRFTRSPDDPRSSRTPTSPTLNQSEILSSPNPKTRRQRQSEGRGEGADAGATAHPGADLAGGRGGWSSRPPRPPRLAVFNG